jgi:hypothetical protein
VNISDEGAPLDTQIEVIKASVKRGGISRTSKTRDLRVASIQLILEAIASNVARSGVDFRVPFIGMKLKLGGRVTKKPEGHSHYRYHPSSPEDIGRQVRGGEEVEEALVNAIEAIRSVTSKAAEGDDPGSCPRDPSIFPSPSRRPVPSHSGATGNWLTS